MGSLYSKPKMPKPIVVASTPVPTPAPIDVPSEPASTDNEKAAAIIRRRSLPETILTSFRGVLSQGDWVPQRKSLLGE